MSTNKEKAIELITGLIKQTRSLCVEHNLPSPEEFLFRLQKEASMVFLAEKRSLAEEELLPIVQILCRFYDSCNWNNSCFHPSVQGNFGKCYSVLHAEQIVRTGFRRVVLE